ncbi:MAG TPA: hypothetical protein VFV73_14935 [Streptosporangiaceae bacterium]|nr:hypothetical protein [Streptosporangiaceae bacterium]
MITNRDIAIRRAGSHAALLVALGLLAACGGSSSPGAPGGSSPSDSGAADAVAHSACMRSHGVPNYPDPRNGQLPKGTAQSFGVSSSQYQAAESACQHLLPASNTNFNALLAQCLENGHCPPTVVQQALTEGRKFAQCMRDHGAPNWPDPTIDAIGRPSFQVTEAGISIDATRSAQMLPKIGYCQDQPGAALLRQE